ncbi:MAG: GGDEF domain-containing protein [Proteobacteria bacterium]|nr:GGDEF domain-containing protein [Pseudomonadota bacterium]
MDVKNTVSIEGELVNWADFLNVRMFKDVDLDAIESLLRACPLVDLSAGETLISPGQTKNAMYLLLSGRLRIHLESVDAKPIAVFNPGESVGELSVIDQKPASTFVVADQASRLLVVPEEIFWALIDASPRIARNLLFTLADRLRGSNAQMSESNRLQQQYSRQATVDELTGLHNRRWFDDMLKRQTMRSSMGGETLSLLLINVDHFSGYNDEFGRAAGEHALYGVAQTMMNNLRPTDLLARYGGQEFIALLADTSIAGAKLVAERLREAIAEAMIVMSDQSILPSVTVSIGVTEMKPFGTGEMLMTDVRAALDRAKENGCNCLAE